MWLLIHGYLDKAKCLEELGINSYDIHKDSIGCEILEKLKSDAFLWRDIYLDAYLTKSEFVCMLKRAYGIKKIDKAILYCKGLLLIYACEEDAPITDICNQIGYLQGMIGAVREKGEPFEYACV